VSQKTHLFLTTNAGASDSVGDCRLCELYEMFVLLLLLLLLAVAAAQSLQGEE